MKKLITILFVLLSVISIAQKNDVPRASAANVVVDQNLKVGQNFYIPRYTDTTAANINLLSTQDTAGAIIFTYDINNFWIRVGPNRPHRWQQGSGGGATLPDGVYSGGQVAYSGTGYIYIVSAATYVLGGVIYNSPQDSIELDPSDPTFDRIDVIGLTSAGVADKVTGVPGANPQEPSVNPQTFIRRSIVTVVANTTQPPNVDQTIIYDEGTGEPTEWTPASEGNTDFLDVQNPYHLTIDALTVAINPGQRNYFINDDTINSVSRSSLVIFTNLLQPLTGNQNINVQLKLSGNPVTVLLPLTKYGLLLNITNKYQMAAIPFPEFGAGDISFDEVDLIMTGSAPFPFFYHDYIQIQSGLATIFSQQNAITSVVANSGAFNAASPNSLINILAVNGLTDTIVGNILTMDASGLIRNQPSFDASHIQVAANASIDGSFFAYKELRVAGDGFFGDFSNPMFSVNQGDNGYVFARRFTSGNIDISGDGTTTVNGAINPRFSFRNGAFLETVTQPLGVRVLNPHSTIGGFYVSDVYDGFGPDANYKILNLLRSDTSVLTVNRTGQIHSADSTVYLSGGIDAIGRNRATGNYELYTLPTGTVSSIAFNTGTGITSTATPLTTTGTIGIDTTKIATRAWVGGGGAPVNVSSFSFTDGAGFDGTVLNGTTTPTLSLTTTVSNGQLIYSNSGAVTGSANLTWVNATARLGVGVTGAAYLSLAPGIVSQASLNIGNAGVAPTSPNNGDVWLSGNHIFIRLNGVTTQIDNQSSSGVLSAIGTANQVNVSGATGNVTFSLPQSIATTSNVTFQRGTFSGAAATSNLILSSHTDPAAAAGILTNNGTRLAFSLATTYKRFIFSNDVTPTAGQILVGNGTDFTVGTASALNNSLLVVPSATGVTYRTNSVVQTLSGTSVTLNANSGWNGQWTLTASGSSLTITNPIAGATYFINAVQDGTGSRTITTYPAGTVWYSGSAPILKTTAGAVNTLAFYYNGSNYYGYDWGSGGGSGFANPMTTLGDGIYGGIGGVATRLAGNTTANIRVLAQTGTGVVSAAPAWTDIISSFTSSATLDFPSIAAQSRQELTIPVTGAIIGDGVIVGATINQTNVIFTGRVSSAGVVTVQANNFGAAAQNPASGTFKVIVVR